MIFANFVSDVMTGLALLAVGFVLIVYLAVAAVALLARHCYRDYQRQGGATHVVPKVVGGTAAKLAGRAVKKWLWG